MTQLKGNIRHLDLFSGIGGFAYAAKTVWGDGYENAGFCEIDPFCQSVLKKNFPGCRVFGDIRTLANTCYARLERGKQIESEGYDGQPDRKWSDQASFGTVDLVTGGFPCQPFSAAGRRQGTDDNRYLWPEMFAVIRRFKPSWVIAENVYGLVTWSEGLVLEQACTDLESESYEVQPFIIPAVAVNAPHRRDRVWIVAHRTGEQNDAERRVGELGRLAVGRNKKTAQQDHGTTSNDSFRGQNSRVTNSNSSGSQEPWSEQQTGRNGQSLEDHADWNTDWKEVALATCLDRVDDGLSRRVVRLPDGSTISHARWRKEALKAYGNAIVPQVAMQIMQAIKEV